MWTYGYDCSPLRDKPFDRKCAATTGDSYQSCEILLPQLRSRCCETQINTTVVLARLLRPGCSIYQSVKGKGDNPSNHGSLTSRQLSLSLMA